METLRLAIKFKYMFGKEWKERKKRERGKGLLGRIIKRNSRKRWFEDNISNRDYRYPIYELNLLSLIKVLDEWWFIHLSDDIRVRVAVISSRSLQLDSTKSFKSYAHVISSSYAHFSISSSMLI